jgi:LuxR family maltose regulon positive regulatory protein
MRLLISDFRFQIEKQGHTVHDEKMRRLLDYSCKLLAAFPDALNNEGQMTKLASSVLRPSSLAEPLSARELEVLQLIAQGLSNREISERLFLALSTVKGHNRNIFDKLQVQSRTEAVARARELGLF